MSGLFLLYPSLSHQNRQSPNRAERTGCHGSPRLVAVGHQHLCNRTETLAMRLPWDVPSPIHCASRIVWDASNFTSKI